MKGLLCNKWHQRKVLFGSVTVRFTIEGLASSQGVVTSIPPIDELATGIKKFNRQNCALIA